MLSLQQTVDREWLTGRFHVLELASFLDRLDRLATPDPQDPRVALLRRAIDELRRPGPDRTERILRMYTELAEAAPAGRR